METHWSWRESGGLLVFSYCYSELSFNINYTMTEYNFDALTPDDKATSRNKLKTARQLRGKVDKILHELNLYMYLNYDPG